MLADSAVLTVDGRSASFSRAPLDQVSNLKRLLQRIDTGRIGPSEARAELAALEARPPRFSKAWQVVGLGLFSTGWRERHGRAADRARGLDARHRGGHQEVTFHVCTPERR